MVDQYFKFTGCPVDLINRKNTFSVQRPKTTGQLNVFRSSLESYILPNEKADLLSLSRQKTDVSRKILELHKLKSSGLETPKFLKGSSKSDNSVRSRAHHTWLTFSNGCDDSNNASLLNAFTLQTNDSTQYEIESNVASQVAEQLYDGERIRIGLNGMSNNVNTEVKKFQCERNTELQTHTSTNDTPCFLPLSWEDQLSDPAVTVYDVKAISNHPTYTKPPKSCYVVFQQFSTTPTSRKLIHSAPCLAHKNKTHTQDGSHFKSLLESKKTSRTKLLGEKTKKPILTDNRSPISHYFPSEIQNSINDFDQTIGTSEIRKPEAKHGLLNPEKSKTQITIPSCRSTPSIHSKHCERVELCIDLRKEKTMSSKKPSGKIKVLKSLSYTNKENFVSASDVNNMEFIKISSVSQSDKNGSTDDYCVESNRKSTISASVHDGQNFEDQLTSMSLRTESPLRTNSPASCLDNCDSDDINAYTVNESLLLYGGNEIK